MRGIRQKSSINEHKSVREVAKILAELEEQHKLLIEENEKLKKEISELKLVK